MNNLRDNPRYGDRLPPYWRRQQDTYNGVWIYTDWPPSPLPEGRRVGMLPRGGDPREYRWPVQGKEVLVLQAQGVEEMVIELLVVLLVESGAKAVRVIHSDDSLSIYSGAQS